MDVQIIRGFARDPSRQRGPDLGGMISKDGNLGEKMTPSKSNQLGRRKNLGRKILLAGSMKGNVHARKAID